MTDRSFRVRASWGGFQTSPVSLLKHAKLLMLAWLVSEVLLFALVVREIGLGGALVFGIITSLVGIAALRRLGGDAVRRLRATVGGQERTDGALFDGGLAALGAILLILPGFVSDLVGLALLTPSLRQTIASRFRDHSTGARVPGRAPPPGVIDLNREEWSASERVRH